MYIYRIIRYHSVVRSGSANASIALSDNQFREFVRAPQLVRECESQLIYGYGSCRGDAVFHFRQVR